MKAAEEKRAHEDLEAHLRQKMKDGQKRHGRRVPPKPARDDRGPFRPWRPGGERGFVAVLIPAYLLLAWFAGIVVADWTQPSFPRYGNTASWCRPHPYDKVGWKPWPFRRGRYTNEWREGDVDICTGEVFRGGRWATP